MNTRPTAALLLLVALAVGCESQSPLGDDDTTQIDDDDTTRVDDDDSTSKPEDIDGDGSSVSMGDCDDPNPAVYPGATEVCNRVALLRDPSLGVTWLAAAAPRNLSTTLRHSSAPFSEPLVRSCPASLRAG